MWNDLPRFALSVRQPWAWAIICLGKDLENRGPMAVRHMTARQKPGPNSRIAIHASQGMTRDEYESARSFMLDRLLCLPERFPMPCDLLRGGLIGTVNFDATVAQSTSLWWIGPRALRLSGHEALLEPIACNGDLGFFDWRNSRPEHRPDWRWGEPKMQEPLPWMTAWPNRFHRYAKSPDGIIRPPESDSGELFK